MEEVYGIPDEENPEWTEHDFAMSRRRDGTLAFPELYAKHMLMDMLASLRDVKGEKRQKIERTLRHVEAALAEMQEG